MRAMVFRRGGLAVEELAPPVPGPEQVLVRTHACGICGSDLHVAKYAEELIRTAPGQTFVTMDLDRGVQRTAFSRRSASASNSPSGSRSPTRPMR